MVPAEQPKPSRTRRRRIVLAAIVALLGVSGGALTFCADARIEEERARIGPELAAWNASRPRAAPRSSEPGDAWLTMLEASAGPPEQLVINDLKKLGAPLGPAERAELVALAPRIDELRHAVRKTATTRERLDTGSRQRPSPTLGLMRVSLALSFAGADRVGSGPEGREEGTAMLLDALAVGIETATDGAGNGTTRVFGSHLTEAVARFVTEHWAEVDQSLVRTELAIDEYPSAEDDVRALRLGTLAVATRLDRSAEEAAQERSGGLGWIRQIGSMLHVRAAESFFEAALSRPSHAFADRAECEAAASRNKPRVVGDDVFKLDCVLLERMSQGRAAFSALRARAAGR